MKIVIVGNGPSLLGELKGSEIDACDFVVRTKLAQFGMQHPEHYGRRIDAICGSWTIKAQLRQVLAKEYWVFLDSRHKPDAAEAKYRCPPESIAEVRKWAYINPGLCNAWNAFYRQKRTPHERHPQMEVGNKHSDPQLGHNHLSAGFHALLYACDKFKPKEITLVGYDNVMSGKFTWSITRGPQFQQYADHRWDIEHEMLKDVEERFGCKILSTL